MSDPLRIGFVVEGPTDFVILDGIAQKLLGGRDYTPVSIQPQLSEAFGAVSGGGWSEVYFWCRQSAKLANGRVSDDPLFDEFDMLIIQVDADVAGFRYSDDGRIADAPNDLPCPPQSCPPPTATTSLLRNVILGWMGEAAVPAKTVLCTPSKALETWVLLALFPQNQFSRSANLECRANPDAQLQAQPLARRLIRAGKKDIGKYRDRAGDVAAAWPAVRLRCTEAERFSLEFVAAAPPPA
jgi:hypothetical protein